MPLLKKKPFEKLPEPDNLRDDEEVFYCAVTDEIFRDYESFSERTMLCNSMVWTCSMTGKNNLTYSEAVESEDTARKSIRDFPEELKRPLMYIAYLTRRSAFGDMVEDVFVYVKDRYFVGENIEATFTGHKWKEACVLKVVAPTNEPNVKSPKNGDLHDRHFKPSPSLYKYQIEHIHSDDADISELMVVNSDQIRRRRAVFTRDKCKLFLRQYVETNERGFFVVKQSAVTQFGLNQITFSDILDGPPPQFEMSRKRENGKAHTNGKAHGAVNGKANGAHNGKSGQKGRQESLDKFLTKGKNATTNGNNSAMLERMKQREKDFEVQKQLKKEQDLALKQKKKEENLMLAVHLKEWYKPKEDLELIDQKVLPDPIPIKSKIPEEHLGDTIMILEFVKSFSKFLHPKDFFPSGLTFEIMERALTENEVAGSLIDLFQMLLSAIFNLEEEEYQQYSNEKGSNGGNDHANHDIFSAVTSATNAGKWCGKHQGFALRHLQIFSLTTSEVLRLHLLGSGAAISNTGARWRYQQRGGYSHEDDPGLNLRLNEPHILRELAVKNVVELPIDDKLKILSCLVNQILTYANVRDVVDERMEQTKQAKSDYKALQIADKKSEQEYIAAKVKVQKEEPNQDKASAELDRLQIERENNKFDNDLKLDDLQKASNEHQIVLGHDRALRQYLKLHSVPGLLVCAEEPNYGECLRSIIQQNPALVDADKTKTLAYLRGTLNTASSSDKENTPTKSPKKLNGSFHQENTKNNEALLMCSGNPETCRVHNLHKEPKWSFFKDTEQLEQLRDSLNVRGIRESELLQNVNNHQKLIENFITNTPVQLNPEVLKTDDEDSDSKKAAKSRHEAANMGYSRDMSTQDILHDALAENLLDMEEKIFAGNLGHLNIKNRNVWRTALQTKNYEHFDKTIRKLEEGVKYRDPGLFLYSPKESTDGYVANQDPNIMEAVSCLAIALAQIGQGVERQYLKKPLGNMGKIKQSNRSELLDNWTRSLLASTSFSQIFLHYNTLDNCVLWARSVLSARCRICRRQHNSEHMLLCDMCNMGHHIYCLKPKLKSIPAGEWFCSKCVKERQAQAEANGESDDEEEEEVVVKAKPEKKRPIFRDEEIEEEAEDEEEEDGDSGMSEDESDEDEDAEPSIKVDLCAECKSGGELICCDVCTEHYHVECVDPPLRRAPRGGWTCTRCKTSKENRYDGSDGGAVVQRTGVMNGQRRCAAKALYKIHDFAKNLRDQKGSDESDASEESDDETEDSSSPVHHPALRSRDHPTASAPQKRTRREEVRADLPLHNAALHEVLTEIMKDSNAWPFLRPVPKNEVPDYYDVIEKPMDFGTIKYKLNMGEYTEDAHFMADAVLVFQNCNTYNSTEDDVYKCGVQLLHRFQKKCRELGLKLPDEMDYNDMSSSTSSHQPKKKPRTK